MTQKILYLITKSNYGGAQKYVFDLANNLPKDQFEVAVAAGGTGEKGAEAGLLAEKLSSHNISFYKIQAFTRDIFLTNELRTFFEIGKLMRTYRPDVLHLNSSKAAGVGGFVGRILGIRHIIYTAHGWPFNEQRPYITRLLIYFFSWLTCFLVHKVIVINQTDFEQGTRMWLVGHKMNLVYNGLSPISFLSRDQAREKLSEITKTDLPESQLLLGTIAELHPNKGLRYLIEALTQTSDWKLIIIGEGHQRAELENLIKKLNLETRVFLAGFVQDAAALLPAFDTFALVSLKEGHPYAVLEAGLASLPVIGSNIPGIRAIIDSDDQGLLVPAADSQAIATALEKLNDKNIRESLGKKLQTKVQSEFSIEKMLEKTMGLY